MLLYFAAFSVVSARERRWFWRAAQQDLSVSHRGGCAHGHHPDICGSPGLLPLPWWQTLAVFTYAMVSCLVVNDVLKVAMIKWRVPNPWPRSLKLRGT